jgi:hypothetical protein
MAWKLNLPAAESTMLGIALFLVLILVMIAALPTWPHSRNWGYYPSGGAGIALVIVVVLLFLGRV